MNPRDVARRIRIAQRAAMDEEMRELARSLWELMLLNPFRSAG